MTLNTYRLYRNKFRSNYGELIICNDSKNYWRKDIFPYYKHGRKSKLKNSELDWDSIFNTMTKIKEEVKTNLPYKNLTVNRTEADDIISVICKNVRDEKILIVSSDKDFQQLQRYDNVEQYSPLKKEFLVCDDPETFLVDHIIKGDTTDGIPNILSDDDVFTIKEKRQKPCGKKKMNEIKEDLSEWSTTDKWKRNQTLIDLNNIPSEYQSAIMVEYESHKPVDRSGMLNYFIDNRLKNLMSNIEEF